MLGSCFSKKQTLSSSWPSAQLPHRPSPDTVPPSLPRNTTSRSRHSHLPPSGKACETQPTSIRGVSSAHRVSWAKGSWSMHRLSPETEVVPAARPITCIWLEFSEDPSGCRGISCVPSASSPLCHPSLLPQQHHVCFSTSTSNCSGCRAVLAQKKS